MASRTLTFPGDLFPEGTSLGAYPATDWGAHYPSGDPAVYSTAVDTQTVTAGAVTFTGLSDGADYYACGDVGSGTYRYQLFSVPTPADVQPLDSDLTAIAALSTTSYGRSLLALADAAAGRTSLGLGSAATHAHSDYLAASSAPVVPWANWRPFSAKIESIPRPMLGTGTAHGMSSGRIVLAACSEPLRAGVTYSWLKFLYSTAPTTPTNQWACLIDGATMNVLRSSTDLTTTAFSNSTYATFTLSSTYTPASDIAKPYVGLLITASSLSGLLYGTTAPGLMVSSALSESDLFGWGASGLTTPLADGVSAGTVGTGFNFFPYYLIG